MKLYHITYNHYWKTAALELEEIPAVLHWLRGGATLLCSVIPAVPMPNWIKFRLRGKKDWDWSDNNDGWVTLRDWYGDTQQWFHSSVCMLVTNFIYKRSKITWINLPYEFLKEKFPEEFSEPDFEFDYEPGEQEAIESAVSEINIQFRESYDLLGYNAIQKRIKYAK